MPHSISPCLWFDGRAQEAAEFYTSIFKDGKITHVLPFPDAGAKVQGGKEGSVMVVGFELNGRSFTALNGGPEFKFSEAISLQVDCVDQAEVDYLWEKLGEGGDPARQQCGWLADKFGVSWQVVPKALQEMIADPNKEKTRRVFLAMMEMKKLDIASLRRAFEG